MKFRYYFGSVIGASSDQLSVYLPATGEVFLIENNEDMEPEAILTEKVNHFDDLEWDILDEEFNEVTDEWNNIEKIEWVQEINPKFISYVREWIRTK